MSTKIYTSTEILAMDELYELLESPSGFIKYQMTEGELGWLNFVNSKYSIADYINENLDDNNVLTIEPYDMSAHLNADNGYCPKAPCLSDETALQKIIFWMYDESANFDNI